MALIIIVVRVWKSLARNFSFEAKSIYLQLCLADDCLLFVHGGPKEHLYLKNILSIYQWALDQEINSQKSGIFCSQNIGPHARNEVSELMGIPIV